MAETFKGLRLHNTLTRTKEDFVPLDDDHVRLYVCGPTVYDFAHIGNARPVIVFDVLFRLLRHLYGPEHVTYVRNVTDVDDKINKRAFERWTRQRPLTAEIRALTDDTLRQFHADVDALGVLRPTHEPRATDFIARGDGTLDMIAVIARLVEKGHAYEAEGHVLFHVPSMPNYGELSRRPTDDLIAGARVEVAPYKRDPMDFVLWKPSDRDTEPGWDSPWGYGRPGWHIECSAMSGNLLGEVFDIHAGGLDLIFPHHENEIAQTCCMTGLPRMANYWLHNGFLQVEGEKMSKSLGNFRTIREVLDDWPGEVIRLNMLKTHYRQPIDWTLKGLEESEKALDGWYRRAGDMSAAGSLDADVLDALADDLNTPLAIARLHQIETPETLKASAGLMGFLPETASAREAGRTARAGIDMAAVEALVAASTAARAAKNWAESDRLRDELAGMGIQLKQGKDPATGQPVTTWEVKR